MVISLIIVVPYAWYAIRINNFAHENKPDGFEFVSFYSQLLITVLGMVSQVTLKKACQYLQPLALKITPTHDNKKEPISEDERI